MDSIGSFMNPNKRLKEEFVSNLTGSSMLELSTQMTLFGLLVLLRHLMCFKSNIDLSGIQASVKNDDAFTTPKNATAYAATLVLDFICILLPFLLFLTVLSDWIYESAFVLALLVYTALVKRFSSTYTNICSLRAHVSSYRVHMMILTCLCILSVDFTIFPRRYAKTETYGISLMDLGVGSFVLSNSLVSRQARNIASRGLMSSLKSTSPLLILGFGRLVFTRRVDYQVHVGEYGVHWNFFFTLAAVTILTSLINIPPQYCGIVGSLILIGYQSSLMQGLNEYLLSTERSLDIISQNKEGVFSVFGYWGIYLVGVKLGNYLFFENAIAMKSTKSARIRVWILACLFWLLTVFLDRHVEKVSRRMCNLSYATSVLAVNLQVLAILMASDYVPGSKISALEEAFNQNLLGSFVVGNVLTGLVNMYVDTMHTSPVMALGVLTMYAFALLVSVGFAKFYGVKLKFW